MKKIFILFFVLITGCTQTGMDSGKVISIADGDTFTLLTDNRKQVKIRLHGIDCPEKGQEFGTAARKKLSSLIFEKKVRIEVKGKDRYGRTVAVVFTEGKLSVNQQMIQSGLAWHYKQYDQNPDWDNLEKTAKQQRIGLWSQPDPTPPWLFRKAKRETATP